MMNTKLTLLFSTLFLAICMSCGVFKTKSKKNKESQNITQENFSPHTQLSPEKDLSTPSTIEQNVKTPPVVDTSQSYTLADYSFTFYDLDGNKVKLSQFKGKVIFLNFWATWCGPCIKELPNIKNLWEDYKDEVVFLLISNEKPDRIKRFEKDKNTGLPFYYYNSGDIPDVYKHSLIPTTFILSKNGKIVKKTSGSEPWDNDPNRQLIENLLLDYDR